MSTGFKILLLFLLLYVAFWCYQLRQSDVALLVKSVQDPEFFETREIPARPPDSSPVDRIVELFGVRQPAPSRLPEPIVSYDPADGISDVPPARPIVVGGDGPHGPRGVLGEGPAAGQRGFGRQHLRAAALEAGAAAGTEIVEHVVQEGETLWKISRKYLGAGQLYRSILEDNKIEDENLVSEGMMIKVRAPARAAPGPEAHRERDPDKTPSGGMAKQRARRKRHQVEDGETLASLARRFYSDPERWRDIFAANQDRLLDPNRVPVGVTLTIP